MADTNLQNMVVGGGDGALAEILQHSTERWLNYAEVLAIFLRQHGAIPPLFNPTLQVYGPGPPYRTGLYLYTEKPRFRDRLCSSKNLGEGIGFTVANLHPLDGDGGELFTRRTHHHDGNPNLALVHYRRYIAPPAAAAAAAAEEEDEEEDDEDEGAAEEENENEGEEEEAAEEEEEEAAAEEEDDESSNSSFDDFDNDPTYDPRNPNNIKGWILSVVTGALTLDPATLWGRELVQRRAYELEKIIHVKLLSFTSPLGHLLSTTSVSTTPIYNFEGHTSDDAVLCVQLSPPVTSSVSGSCAEDGLLSICDYDVVPDRAAKSPAGILFNYSVHSAGGETSEVSTLDPAKLWGRELAYVRRFFI